MEKLLQAIRNNHKLKIAGRWVVVLIITGIAGQIYTLLCCVMGIAIAFCLARLVFGIRMER